MHYAGIDLHRRTTVIAIEDKNGPIGKSKVLTAAIGNPSNCSLKSWARFAR